MAEHIPTRDEAMSLLKEYNKSDGLIKHACAVEGAMRYIARTMGEDEEKWGIVGLVHDIDYERFPQEHCAAASRILGEKGWPQEYIRAVASHGWGLFCDTEPKTNLEKMLYTIDELTGLVAATALVRPSKSLADLEVKSVMKKWKDKAFAAGVNRAVIEKGAAMLGMELADLIDRTIKGMREVAGTIGF